MQRFLQICFLSALLSLLTFYEVKAQDKPNVPTVDFCELVKNHQMYDKKIIRIKAIYKSDYGGSSIYDYKCGSGDALMDAWYEKSKIYKTKKKVNKKYNEILNAESENNSSKAYVTVIGRFNDWNGFGHGHFGWSRFQFAVMAFESVESVAPSTPWNENKSDFMAEIENLRNIDSKWSSIYSGLYVENSNDIFATDYTFKDLQGKKFDKSQFLTETCNARNAKGRDSTTGKVFINENEAFVEAGESISYICPTTISCQYRYDNFYQKQNGQWKLIRTQITSDKSTLKFLCY